MTPGDWLAVGVAIIIALAYAFWRFASLRTSLVDKWSERIHLAQVGINERATELLREMQGEIADLLGTGEDFDPLDVIGDPGVLKDKATAFLRLIRLRDRAEARYRLLLRTGPRGLFASIGLVISMVVIFLHLSEIVVMEAWILWLGGIVAAVSLAVLVFVVAMYSYLQHKLSQLIEAVRHE